MVLIVDFPPIWLSPMGMVTWTLRGFDYLKVKQRNSAVLILCQDYGQNL